MKIVRTVLWIIFLSILWIRCEQDYSERYLYIAVAGDYGIPFDGSYGDQFNQHDVHSRTPDYYYFHLRKMDNNFVGEFSKALSLRPDLRILTVRLYLKEFPKPASLLVETSQLHPDSTIVVTFHD